MRYELIYRNKYMPIYRQVEENSKDFWMSIVATLWNWGVPVLSTAAAMSAHPAFFLITVIPAFFTINEVPVNKKR